MKRTARGLPLDDPNRRRLPPLLRRAWYGLNQAFRRRIAPLGATPDQFTVLRLLSEASPDGLTQRELCNQMCSDPNTMASLAGRMEEAGWIERRPHESDGRAIRVRLKPAGRKLYARLRKLALGLQEKVLGALTESRREQFLADLEKIAEVCQAENERLDKRRRKNESS